MPSRRRLTVLIADDHPVWRRGLRDMLAADFDVIAEASEGAEALKKALASHPDVVALDGAIPGLAAMAVARHLAKALPTTRVVLMTLLPDAHERCAARRVGAAYLVKDDVAQILIGAFTDAARHDGRRPARFGGANQG